MVTASKPLTSGTIKAYHREEYSNPDRAYYTEGNQLQGEWHGRLADEIGLKGAVLDEHFDRLADGQDPFTGEQLIQFRSGKAVAEGKEVEHRAGIDFMFAPAKSVSLTALVGGDKRILEWHRQAWQEAASFGERYTQARGGGNNQPLTTGKWIAAAFEHDTARPVDGYPAPQLHTHLIVFNITAIDANGKARAMQPKELYNLQSTMSRVYQNRLAYELRRGGYELERGKNHAPEIKGYSREYLESESQRSVLIQREIERLGFTSARAAEIVAHQNREVKLKLTPQETRLFHRAHGELFGQQADAVVRESRERVWPPERLAQFAPTPAVDFAIRRLSERHAVIERDGYKQQGGIVHSALTYSQGYTSLQAIEKEIERRKETGELLTITHYRSNAPGERYATQDMLRTEREMIEHVISTQGSYRPIAPAMSRSQFQVEYAGRMNEHQSAMVWDAISGNDKIFGVQGAAGSGKTHATKLLAEITRNEGYTVKGITPTSSARKELERAGIPATTLAKHNLQNRRGKVKEGRNLYLLDESSLAGAKAMHRFLEGLKPNDRVMLIGDTRQHDSIDAGKAFAQLQDAGMKTIPLEHIVRQRENPELLAVVQSFQRGEIKPAIEGLDRMNAIHEIGHREQRFEALAKEFAQSPADSIAIAPDNLSRQEINQAIRKELRHAGVIGSTEYVTSTLLPRNDLYSEDSRIAASYEVGNWVRSARGSNYRQVLARDTMANTITVGYLDGSIKTYNPEKFESDASIYRSDNRQFAQGEKVQLTAQWKEQGLANRERGTIESLDKNGNAALRMEKGNKLIRVNLRDFSHLDYGYSTTSYSSQSITIRNVLAHVDTGDSRISAMLDKVSAYVMASRASHKLSIYTDNKGELVRALDRVEIRPTALSREQTTHYSLDLYRHSVAS